VCKEVGARVGLMETEGAVHVTTEYFRQEVLDLLCFSLHSNQLYFSVLITCFDRVLH
jgi:hypothetical protein